MQIEPGVRTGRPIRFGRQVSLLVAYQQRCPKPAADMPGSDADQVEVHVRRPHGKSAARIPQRQLGMTEVYPPNLVQPTRSPAMIAAHGAGKLFTELPDVDGVGAGRFGAGKVPARVDRPVGLPCDRDPGVIHFDRARDETAEQQTGQGEGEVSIGCRDEALACRTGDDDIGET
jgi:hypothetical protein